MKSEVPVLGCTYLIEKKTYDEDECFERSGINGYCDWTSRKIVYCDMDTYKGWENEDEFARRAQERLTVRHEIVHAFFNESGLMASAHRPSGSWSVCEECVDWIAIQGQKIYEAWRYAGCLDTND